MENSKDERDEKLVELAKVQGDFEAQILKGMLESEGIGVAVRTGVTPIILPFTVDGLGQVRLFVKESDLEAAKAVMRKNEERRGAGELEFDESAGNEELEDARETEKSEDAGESDDE
jgi:Putative prokaryotic signal transducing protein